jgi:predicted nucleic acid-binding protein
VKFWDASAIVPLLVAEESTRPLQALAAKDVAMLVWWGSVVECISALVRLERDGALSSPAMTLALQRLQQLSAGSRDRPKRRNPGNGVTISPRPSAACR